MMGQHQAQRELHDWLPIRLFYTHPHPHSKAKLATFTLKKKKEILLPRERTCNNSYNSGTQAMPGEPCPKCYWTCYPDTFSPPSDHWDA